MSATFSAGMPDFRGREPDSPPRQAMALSFARFIDIMSGSYQERGEEAVTYVKSSRRALHMTQVRAEDGALPLWRLSRDLLQEDIADSMQSFITLRLQDGSMKVPQDTWREIANAIVAGIAGAHLDWQSVLDTPAKIAIARECVARAEIEFIEIGSRLIAGASGGRTRERAQLTRSSDWLIAYRDLGGALRHLARSVFIHAKRSSVPGIAPTKRDHVADLLTDLHFDRNLFDREIATSIGDWIASRLEDLANEEAGAALREVADAVVARLSGVNTDWQYVADTRSRAKIAQGCLMRVQAAYFEIGQREVIGPFEKSITDPATTSPLTRTNKRLLSYIALGKEVRAFSNEVAVHSKLMSKISDLVIPQHYETPPI